jgi:hypothetical protein
MRRISPSLPAPATVISLVALFVALGGSAYAAITVNGSQIKIRSISGNRLKNHTITGTQVNVNKLGTVPRAAKATAATTANSASFATVAATANSATSAANATNAGELGNLPASAYQPSANIMFATVKTSASGGTLVRGRGATGITRLGTGDYAVSFNQSVANCTWIATAGEPDATAADAAIAVVRAHSVATPDEVEVFTFSSFADAPAEGQGFHLAVFCP